LFRSGIWPADRLWQMSVVSVLAQLGTLPFVLNAFGQFPAWFLPANLIIIPLATMIIILAFILILLTPLSLFTGFLASALNFLLELTAHSARIISNLPGSADFGRVLLWPETIGLLLAIWAFLYYVFFMRYKNLKITLLTILMILSVSTFRYFRTKATSEIIIYNQTNTITLGVRSGHLIWIYSENGEPDQAVLRHISAISLRVSSTSPVVLPSVIEFEGYKLLLTDDYSAEMIHKHNPDILITKKVPKIFKPPDTENKLIIFVTSGSSNVIIIADDDAKDYSDSIYFIPEDGAQFIKTGKYRKKGWKILD